MSNWVYSDGGRGQYFKGKAGDCAARAMAIALNRDYLFCYDELAIQVQSSTGKRSARNGVLKSDYTRVLARHGFHWFSAPIFQNRKARCADLTGVVIARQAKHYVAVIDGVVHDTFDSTQKMVYGYWARRE